MQYDVFKSVRATESMTIVVVSLPGFIPNYLHTEIPLFLFNFPSVNFEYFCMNKSPPKSLGKKCVFCL